MNFTFWKAFNAGVIIGLGGTCFLAIDNKVVGAFMFSLGLLTICVTQQYLFTGKCSYTNDVKYLLTVILGNIIGATWTGRCIGIIKPELVDKATEMCQTKLGESYRIIFLAIFCNILIYFAVEGYKKCQTILLIMCVMAFILCGFEHSVANIFYFAVAGKYSVYSILYLVGNVAFNWIGGLLVFYGRKYCERKEHGLSGFRKNR